MNKKLVALLLVLVMVITLGLVGCKKTETPVDTGNQPADQEPADAIKRGGVVRFAIWNSPPGLLNPHLYTDHYDATVLETIFGGMVTLNPQLEWEPYLAESYKISDDSLVMEFKLREGLTFHDGTPLTTEDVAFTFHFIADPDYSGPRFNDITAIKGVQEYRDGEADHITGIEIINDREIRFTLNKIHARALGDIAAKAILPKHIWKDVPLAEAPERTDLLRNPIGAGPFKMVQFVPDQYAELEAFDGYWQGRPIIDKLIIQVANQETAQAQLARGELDFMEVSGMNNDNLEFFRRNNIPVIEVMSRGYQYMGFNMRLEIFQDRRVRQAFAHAINRQGFVDNIMEGYGLVAHGPLPAQSWAYPPLETLNLYPHNPDKAKELLIEAGWEFRDGKMFRNGQPVKLTLKYPQGNVVREKSAPVIQQNLADIGIELELLIMEFGTLSEQVIDNHDFDLFLMGWGLTSDPDVYGIWHSSLAGPGGWNMVGFINERSDYLLEKGRTILDPEDRKPVYHEWVQLVNQEAPVVFLYHMLEGRAHNPNLRGLNVSSFSGNFYGVHLWHFVE